MTLASTLRHLLEPTGLTFSAAHPAELDVWYDGAGSDFDGDGDADEDDEYIENELLGIQAHPGLLSE